MLVETQILLNSGFKIPSVGFGTWQATGDTLEAALNWALEAGYRHLDTATVYENEEIVGKVINEWISAGKVTREELFIVTKLPAAHNSPKGVAQEVAESLKKLQLKYIDLYLIHVPFAFKEGNDYHPRDKDGFIQLDLNNNHVEIWKAMEGYVKSGQLRSIGISNFNQSQIERVWNNSEIKPSCLQVEMHILLQQKTLLDYCNSKGIVVTAYSPLGTKDTSSLFQAVGYDKDIPNLLGHAEVLKISQTLKKSPAQILLRFLLEKGVVVIPKSTTKDHIKANIQVYDFELGNEATKALENLDQGESGRILDFTIFKGVEKHPEYPFQRKL